VPAGDELLEAESWGNILAIYANSVDVAVAFVNHAGELIGKCHNPQPIWSLARKARPDWGPGCPFCLLAAGQCTAAADAERTHSLILARDLGGYVHIATPVFLGERHLGTLLAGQVFDQYPELLLLEKVAAAFQVSEDELWRLALQRLPMSRATLTVYGNLLGVLGHAYVRERHATILKRSLAETNDELRSSYEALRGKLDELDQSLGEKNVLLNEVHHRVNNNLAVIASLLRMQADASPAEGEVADALRASQNRLESMALIHAQLYNSADWCAVNFAEYVRVLAENLFRSYRVDESRINRRVEISPFNLSVDKAIPAGLILNELISNVLKHAFPNGRRGFILIQGRLRDDRVELLVQDDGAGIKKTTEPRQRKSLGLKIVEILCRQLKGTFLRPDSAEGAIPGSIFHISFPHAPLSRAVGDRTPP